MPRRVNDPSFDTSMRSSFRVVTLNILHDPPQLTWPKRAPLVEAGLIALQPDIVLLQEVAWPDEQATSLAAALREHTGRPYVAHLTGLLATTGWQEGLAILSRYPRLDASDLVFPEAEAFCQRVRFEIQGKKLDVYNSHLDPYSGDRRSRQIAMAVAWLDEYRDGDGLVFGGDLNATPQSAAIAPLSSLLRSAYAVASGADPENAIDYLWISPSLSVTKAGFAMNQPSADDPSLKPSDHQAVYADLAWTTA